MNSFTTQNEREKSLYREALEEYEEGNMDKGTWAKAIALGAGNDTQVKSHYIRLRYEELNAITPPPIPTQSRANDASIGLTPPPIPQNGLPKPVVRFGTRIFTLVVTGIIGLIPLASHSR